MLDIPTPPHRKQADGDIDEDDDDDDATAPGIVLRTDYSSGSDEAWTAFCGALRDAEREFLADQQEGPASAAISAPDDDGDVEVETVPSVPASESAPRSLPADGAESHAAQVGDEVAKGDAEEEGEEGEEGEEEGEGLALFSLVSDSTCFDGISNLRALRLLFDISVRAAPGPSPAQSQPQPQPRPPSSLSSTPHHQQKHQHQHQNQHQHRLTCKRGLQETYETRGRTLWIFDARSRIDTCARLVSEAGDVATSVPSLTYLLPSIISSPCLTSWKKKTLLGEIAGARA
jgi:hypothetical protein